MSPKIHHDISTKTKIKKKSNYTVKKIQTFFLEFKEKRQANFLIFYPKNPPGLS
jgi:hypothetical protein